MKQAYIIIISFLLTSYISVKAQDQAAPYKENLTFNIDNFGDGHIETTWTMNASQWDNFKKMMGTNEDVLKRGMERSLPSYFLQNFVYKEDAMNRSYTLSFDALGLAKINDNGQWEIDMDYKNPDITKISDKNYALNTTFNSGGTQVQELVKVNIPDAASDISQQKDAFGKAMFTYTLTPGHKKISFIFLALGILLIAAAAVTYFKPELFKPGKKEPVKYPFQAQQAPVAAQATKPEQEQTSQPKAANDKLDFL